MHFDSALPCVGAKGTIPDAAAWAAALKHRPNFSKKVGEYAATYGVKERGMKKWIEDARADWIAAGSPVGGPDFPPLDDPPKMLTWWLAHKKHQPSAELLALAGRSAESLAAEKSPAPAPAGADPKPAVGTRAAIDVASLAGMDLSAAAQKQRQLLEAAHQALLAAQKDPTTPEATINLLSKRWDDAFERLRKVEDSLAAAEKARGHMIHVNDLRAELAPVLLTLATSLPNELEQRLGIDRARAVLFCDRWFRHLRGTRFLDGIVPSLTPTSVAA